MHFSNLFHQFGELTVTGLAQGAIIALFALGYTLVYGVLRLINFAHSEVFTVGAFTAVIVWGGFGLNQDSPTPGLGGFVGYLLIGLVAAMAASAVTALVIELVAYRPLRRRNAPPLAFLITAIGASIAISEFVGVLTHRNNKGVPRLIKQEEVFPFLDGKVTDLQIFIVVVALVMMVGLDLFINRTRLGRGIRAVSQNPDSAALMGVNKNRVISLVFLLGGLMAGVAAIMYLLKIGNVRYDNGLYLGVEAFAAAVLGGIGNLRGALLGGIVLGLFENYVAGLFATNWHSVGAFVLLVALLMFRPTGLLGESLGRARA
ncbi:branched-chain amino acid ABC transporter permease [Planosporangium thailandense]|uniref:Branched-chain amino acid ABC transporter permease n=1 Tax=Planosporangium thailandense TaxID=765197 RepID=A0ABX0XYL3_9ACTN|nr:branched-chain amino acid ABC transporter permease [Planosporangium thailandense]NJC70465.1 branched-chain amino acid ABC transporter permease [Planosporangium thailandense]